MANVTQPGNPAARAFGWAPYCCLLVIVVLACQATAWSRQLVPDRTSGRLRSSGQLKDRDMGNPLREGGDHRSVEALISQLGSPAFAERQSATERLWGLGESALQPLKTAAASSENREVQSRSRSLLQLMELGIKPGVSSKTARLVRLFDESSVRVQSQIIAHLNRQNEFRLSFALLGQIKDPDQLAELFQDAISFNDILMRLAREQSWEEIEYLLNHPIANRFEPLVCVYYRLASQTLDELIASKRDECEHAADSATTQEQRFRLAGLYRVQNRYDKALEQANQIVNQRVQAELKKLILMESGQWTDLLAQLVPPDVQQPADPLASTFTPTQRPLLAYFADNFEQARSELDSLIVQFEQTNFGDRNEEREAFRATICHIALAIMDWNLAAKFVSSDDRLDLFEVLIVLERYDEAFAIIELGETFAERCTWVQRRVRNLKSLDNKIQRQDENGEDSNLAEEDFEKTWRLCCDVVGHLGALGFTNESLYHYRVLFDGIKNNRESFDQRSDIVRGLLALEAYDQVWQMVEREFTEDEHENLIYALFPYKSESARFWHQRISDYQPDSIQCLQMLARLLNSPLADFQGFSVDEQLAVCRQRIRKSSSQFEFEVARVLRFHGRFEESDHLLQTAADLGDAVALQQRAVQLLDDRQFEEAAATLDRLSRDRSNSLIMMLQAEAMRGLGKPRQAALFETIGFVYWHDSYRTTTILGQFAEVGRLHRLIDFLKIYVVAPGGSQISNERYRNSLAVTRLATDPTNAAIDLQIGLLKLLDDPTTGIRRYTYWADTTRQIAVARAQSEIASGDVETAFRRMQESCRFRPGDPTIGESILPDFERVAKPELAETLFEELTGFYVKIRTRFPTSQIHRNNFAWICAKAERKLDLALEASQAAVAARPNNPSYLDTLAELSFLTGRRNQAIKLSKKCIMINPGKRHYHRQWRRFGE
jgi:tetratricopeptide (TPR) repeat protein